MNRLLRHLAAGLRALWRRPRRLDDADAAIRQYLAADVEARNARIAFGNLRTLERRDLDFTPAGVLAAQVTPSRTAYPRGPARAAPPRICSMPSPLFRASSLRRRRR